MVIKEGSNEALVQIATVDAAVQATAAAEATREAEVILDEMTNTNQTSDTTFDYEESSSSGLDENGDPLESDPTEDGR